MKLYLLFICSIAVAQDYYQGEITFDYNGTINGPFLSSVQDSITSGFAFNQEGCRHILLCNGGNYGTGFCWI